MAQIVLSQAGAAIGSSLLPSGLTVFGQTIAGAAIGRAVGSLAGRAIDASMMPANEGPRLKSLHVMESREGAGLPTVFGRMRVGGQIIWASQFLEKRKERSAGKGGPKYAEYSYSVSFAVALCQGPITRVDRIWANGAPIALAGLNWRLYHGDETQQPDPLIEAIEGNGNAPAYRGVAYIVFEDLPLDAYGNRLPQLSFEVIRAGDVQPNGLRVMVGGVNVIPATGEFVYGTQVVRERRFPGIERALNMNNGEARADFSLSIDQLQSDLPNVGSTTLTVAWFGDNVAAGTCRIKPGVETRDRDTVPYGWTVDGTGRGSAHLISDDGNGPNYGGTPSDTSVLEGIAALKAAGMNVTLSPFLLMDTPGFPWRGRITVTADGTAAARTEIDTFIGSDGAFGYRHFILHHARLAAAAGGVDAILLGSEMRELTRVRDDAGQFPFVEALIQLAQEVRAIVGVGVKISYAADWTEYGAYVPTDGSNDVLFPLDDLWASPDIDFVGVDWYPPVGDWRDGDQHLDKLAGYSGPGDPTYLLANMAGGEAYDWYYADAAARDAQVRTPIVDGAHGEDWIFRAKDLLGWASAIHFERPGGVRSVTATGWLPNMKPIRLTEIGFPAVDRGGNAPNLFFDPKSTESALPPFSNGARDDLFHRRALQAALAFWQARPEIDGVFVWAWDARPWPHYPVRTDIWSDGPNWQLGHWLNGRTGLIELSEVIDSLSAQAGVPVDTKDLFGFVEGFAIEGISSLRSALSPLEAAFGINCIEQEGVIRFRHQGYDVAQIQNAENSIEGGTQWSRTLLDKVPGRLLLNYISGDGGYEPALAEARHAVGEADFVLRLNMPLVMGEGHARSLASILLSQTVSSVIGSASEGPASLTLEPGDRILDATGTGWQVSDIADDGLRRELQLQPDTGAGAGVLAIDPADPGSVAGVPADPAFFVLDGPILPARQGGQPLVAVTADPWPGQVSVRAGPDAASLTTRAVVNTPAAIGRLQAQLLAGAIGVWDEKAILDVVIPGADVSSQTSLAVLNGSGLLLVQKSTGWELLAYRTAQLIGEDRWQLSGLLRGLSGTASESASTGAIVILADERVLDAQMVADEIGLPLVWSAGQSESTTFDFNDLAGLSWRVGHLQAAPTSTGWALSWTRRGADVPDSWALPETGNSGTFRVETWLASTLIEAFEVTSPDANVLSGADTVRVAEIGDDGRVGQWASIPLLAA